MTTLAIIGAGIAGQSLIYTLAKSKKSFSKILVFESDDLAQTCSRRSTAIVAPRGVSPGHSDLGDLLVHGLRVFQDHVQTDKPSGIYRIIQYTGALTKLEMFKKRYPGGDYSHACGPIQLKESFYLAQEEAFMIDPEIYLNWLKENSTSLNLQWRTEFVTEINDLGHGVQLKTINGHTEVVDTLVVTAGASTRFWQPEKSGKPVQGSYLEFYDIDLGPDSYSLTLEGDNMIYHSHSKKLLIGSTTSDHQHIVPPFGELSQILQRLSQKVDLVLPSIDKAKVMTGLREKAPKRHPYLYQKGNIHWMGGLYKNGYSLSLHLAQELNLRL